MTLTTSVHIYSSYASQEHLAEGHAALIFATLQVLFPNKDIGDLQKWYATEETTLSDEAKSIICKTLSRKRMQDKYIGQILDLYEDFHVVLQPLLDHEIRGVKLLEAFSELLMDPDAREVNSLQVEN